MPQQWGIRLAVEGDLRFLSHQDTARAIERTAVRAALPLRYSQGFNPHPKLSLACPRPVGVATVDDLLVLTLEDAAEVDEASLLDRLNRCAPRGMRFLSARRLAGRESPQPCRVRYEAPVSPARRGELRSRLDDLAGRESWPVERFAPPGRRGQEEPQRIDLRSLVSELTFDGETLTVALVPQGQRWARPAEVLELLGLDGRVDLAAMVRTKIDCRQASPDTAANNEQENLCPKKC